MEKTKINDYRNALVEVEAVLNCLSEDVYNEIPKEIIDLIEENKNTEDEQQKENVAESNKVIENKPVTQTKTTTQNTNTQTTNKQNTSNQTNTQQNTGSNTPKANNTATQTPVQTQQEQTQKPTQEEKQAQLQVTETPKPTETKQDNTPQNNQTQETKPTTCTNANNHFTSVGNSGQWFATQKDAIAFYESKIAYWGKKWENDEIDDQTYYKNCPYGYETWSCGLCGKWTINFYYR